MRHPSGNYRRKVSSSRKLSFYGSPRLQRLARNLMTPRAVTSPKMRIGYGWDSHEFKTGVPLKIGGVDIKHPKGLGGHSDGDVLLHAITDALLGGIAAGDIGSFFPPSDPKWKGADSSIFLAEAIRQVHLQKYAIENVDTTLILEEPKIGPHAKTIQHRVAELLGVRPD